MIHLINFFGSESLISGLEKKLEIQKNYPVLAVNNDFEFSQAPLILFYSGKNSGFRNLGSLNYKTSYLSVVACEAAFFYPYVEGGREFLRLDALNDTSISFGLRRIKKMFKQAGFLNLPVSAGYKKEVLTHLDYFADEIYSGEEVLDKIPFLF